MNKLWLEDIEKVYNPGKENEVRALSGVNLSVAEGEMLGIVGTSGSGKSTLLHIIAGLDRPTAGRYFHEGRKVRMDNGRQMAQMRNKQVGIVLQHFGLVMEYKASENVEIPLIFAKMPRGRRRRRALEVMESLGIGHLAQKPCRQLSGGEKQRVAMARALANNPPLVLADEPTGALDSKTSREIIGVLRGMTAQGRTVVIVTHDPAVASVCDRVLQIEDGRIVAGS
jgi:putative ABC transport system ATP-binding protein